MKRLLLIPIFILFSSQTPLMALSAPEVLHQGASTGQTYEIREEINTHIKTYNQEFEEILRYCEGISTPALANLAVRMWSIKNDGAELPTAESLVEGALTANHPIVNRFPDNHIISSQKAPKLYSAFIECCEALELPLQTLEDGRDISDIELFVSLNPAYFNAYAETDRQQTYRHITLGLPLVNRLSDEEIKSLLAHELSHCKCGHLSRRTFTNLTKALCTGMLGGAVTYTALTGAEYLRRSHVTDAATTKKLGAAFCCLGFLSLITPFILRAIDRREEHEADAGARTVTGEEATINMLRKLNVGQYSIDTDYDPQDFVTLETMIETEFEKDFEKDNGAQATFQKALGEIKAKLIERNTGTKKMRRWFNNLLSTHPSAEERIHHVETNGGAHNE